jgi:RNA polymerase sigma-70 factor (ECF subfamily)
LTHSTRLSIVRLMPETQADARGASRRRSARRIAGGLSGSTDAEEAELYRRFAPRVRLYGRRHLQNDAASDDLAQDVLLLTIERLRAGEVRRPAEIGSFILGTSRMMAHSERRVARRREALAARFMETKEETAPTFLAALDAPRVAACLRALAERDRLVVLLTYGREAPRIAQDLGVTGRSPRDRHRAMARLRDCVLGRAVRTSPDASGSRSPISLTTRPARCPRPRQLRSRTTSSGVPIAVRAPRSSTRWSARSGRRSNLRKSAGS